MYLLSLFIAIVVFLVLLSFAVTFSAVIVGHAVVVVAIICCNAALAPVALSQERHFVVSQHDVYRGLRLGVALTLFTRWETGKDIPTNGDIAKIERTLGVKLPRTRKVKVEN